MADGISWAEAWGHLSFFVWSSKEEPIKKGGLPKGTIIWTDSKSAQDVARSEMNKPKARWMGLKWYKVKDFKDSIKFCISADQKADMLTKAPTKEAINAALTDYGECDMEDLKNEGVDW